MPSANVHLFHLIDAYAAARADREAHRDAAPWAFLDAHRAMIAARTSVARELGHTPAQLDDDETRSAAAAIARLEAATSRTGEAAR